MKVLASGLATNRQPLAQLVFCQGCCCGRTDRGRPELPVARLKDVWQTEKLNRSVQLTISGCLGPCDLANVALLIAPMATNGSVAWQGPAFTKPSSSGHGPAIARTD